MTNDNLQWHPAFFAGIQIELFQEADFLIFENEHSLGTKPKQIDVLIIKKYDNVPIRKNIGRIFRKYNIIEYKSPTDYLSVDDFYLVYAYACLYKSDTIVLTQELTDEENLWLHNLTNNIQEKEVIERLLMEYQKHSGEKLYSSVMNIITNANAERFKEVTGMCEALERIYLEVNGERLARERKEELDKAVAEAVAEAVKEAVEKTRAEQAAYIKELEAKLAMQNA